jgi:hypothetical protein
MVGKGARVQEYKARSANHPFTSLAFSHTHFSARLDDLIESLCLALASVRSPIPRFKAVSSTVASKAWQPGLFKKVTGLTVKDFELLVSLGLFNSALMNDAVYKFKRYEDASLTYTGIIKHKDEDIGLYDTVITRQDAEEIFENIPARKR